MLLRFFPELEDELEVEDDDEELGDEGCCGNFTGEIAARFSKVFTDINGTAARFSEVVAAVIFSGASSSERNFSINLRDASASASLRSLFLASQLCGLQLFSILTDGWIVIAIAYMSFQMHFAKLQATVNTIFEMSRARAAMTCFTLPR